MNFAQTIDFLYTRLPMFSRQGASAIKKDLTNTLRLCEALGNPHKKFKSIHVAGTNGKGSVSHMLAAVLQTAGYRTGLYTSPHLKDFRERIRVSGAMITENEVVDFVRQNRLLIEEVQPSFFELTVAMAFALFAHKKVDVAVIETGLGGRLDSTNVITPVLSVITNIGHDHQDLLGDTLVKIAAEKAGIIKAGVPVVVGERQDSIAHVFTGKAAQMNAEIKFASQEWLIKRLNGWNSYAGGLELSVQNTGNSFNLPHTMPGHILLDLTGYYQQKNLGTVMQALVMLQNLGFVIDREHISTGLSQVQNLTGLQGRWQVLAQKPLTVADTGHNYEGMLGVTEMISSVARRKLHFVLGMVSDKDHSAVLGILPEDAIYYFCRPDIPRGLDAHELQLKAGSFGLLGKVFLSVKEAYTAAVAAADDSDFIFIGGSTFVVAEVM